jgi:hypothetical protein
MSKVLSIGVVGETPTMDDVNNVAKRHINVDLDAKNLARIRKESPKPAAFTADADTPFAAGDGTGALSAERTRAGLCCLLLRLSTGNSGVRDVVLLALKELINGSDAKFASASTDAAALAELPAFFHGQADALRLSAAAASAIFRHIGDPPPAVSAHERAQLVAGLPLSCGLMSLATVQMRSLLSLSTSTLALSCEAFRASTKPFAAKTVEASHNKAAIAVAAEVLSYLEASTFVNAKPKDGGAGTMPELTQVRSTVSQMWLHLRLRSNCGPICDCAHHCNARYGCLQILFKKSSNGPLYVAPNTSPGDKRKCALKCRMKRKQAVPLNATSNPSKGTWLD